MSAANKTKSLLTTELSEQLKSKTNFSLYLINQKEKLPLVRLEVAIDLPNLPKWLAQQNYFPKIFFEDQLEQDQLCSLGTIYSTFHVPSIKKIYGEDSSSPRFYGGQDFFLKERKTELWQEFPFCCFHLPMIEIVKTKEKTSFFFNLITPHSCFTNYINAMQTILSTLIFETNDEPYHFSKFIFREDLPSFHEWKKKLDKLLCHLKEGSLDKIVLARKTKLEFSEKINPLDVLDFVKSKAKNSILFAFQFSPDGGFIGTTPEILYKRKGKLIESTAIAGTRKRGKNKKEDQKLSYELLSCQKENQEFSFVSNFIKECVRNICEQVDEEQKSQVIQTGSVQHLMQTFRGKLKEEITDKDLLSYLHPTPALGGVPKEHSMNMIYEMESFDRGWYGSPIGWVTEHSARFYVGIRSALIHKNFMHLFAGTGIIKESCPIKEWEELEQKITGFLI